MMFLKCLIFLFFCSFIEAQDKKIKEDKSTSSTTGCKNADDVISIAPQVTNLMTSTARVDEFRATTGTFRNAVRNIMKELYPYQYTPKSCPFPHLDNGRVRVRQRTKLVKFMCSARYELVGNRYATCRNGEWDVPTPVCVKPGCRHFSVENAVQIKAHHDAWVVTFCMPGFKLVGSSAIYCNGYRWNATSPSCVNTTTDRSLSCDFETPYICGWTQDELHDFDWKRLSKKTPSSFLNTGPSYDHTFGKGGSGHYMYIEGTSRLENDTARLLSPVYDAYLAVNGCFSFFYHMFGQTIGGLKIYQKPDRLSMEGLLNMTDAEKEQYVLFEQWGNLGDFWYSAAPSLKDLHDSFQIIIEGIRGSSFTSDIAIDDVAILQGINCTYFRNAATTPSPVYSETCSGRCNLAGYPEPANSCECSPSCLANDRCCTDFMELCVFSFGNNTSSSEPDESSPYEQPQTEKLVGESTTTVTTSTTPVPTTTPRIPSTPRPTLRTLPTTPPPTTKVRPETTRLTTQTTRLTTTRTTLTEPTKPVKTTKLPATTNKVATTKKVEATTQKITTKKVFSTTQKTTVVPTKITTMNHTVEEKKSEKELNVQKMVSDKPVENKSSSWKTAVITIVCLSVFAALMYLGVASRTARGRVVLARLRGRATHDSEVRYLNSNDDDL